MIDRNFHRKRGLEVKSKVYKNCCGMCKMPLNWVDRKPMDSNGNLHSCLRKVK